MTEQEIAALRAELETLRKTNNELLAKKTAHKARIAELEASNAESQTQLTTVRGELHELTIGTPLKAMAESISNVPELWIEQLNKSYRLEMVNGELSLLNIADGKPVTVNGKPVPFERRALIDLLTGKDHLQSKVFSAITVSRASGGAAPPVITPERKPASEPAPRNQFGLR
ncbi:MAG: hypothetical protein WBW84_13580 [Acidobacteriaceae bacterium]